MSIAVPPRPDSILKKNKKNDSAAQLVQPPLKLRGVSADSFSLDFLATSIFLAAGLLVGASALESLGCMSYKPTMNSTKLELSATSDAVVVRHPVSSGAFASSSKDNAASQPLPLWDGPQFQGHRRTASEFSDCSSALPFCPSLVSVDSFADAEELDFQAQPGTRLLYLEISTCPDAFTLQEASDINGRETTEDATFSRHRDLDPPPASAANSQVKLMVKDNHIILRDNNLDGLAVARRRPSTDLDSASSGVRTCSIRELGHLESEAQLGTATGSAASEPEFRGADDSYVVKDHLEPTSQRSYCSDVRSASESVSDSGSSSPATDASDSNSVVLANGKLLSKAVEDAVYNTTMRLFNHFGPCRNRGGDDSSLPPPSSETSCLNTNADQPISVGSSRKRVRDDGDVSEDDSKNGHPAVKKRRNADHNRPYWACPFAKKNPNKHRRCYRLILTRIRDVKQHLFRTHRFPIYCPVCCQTFTLATDRDDHTRLRSCLEGSAANLEGVSEEQRDRLSRRVNRSLSEEQQWFTIWDILFPDCPRPTSPYYDPNLAENMMAFRDFMASQGPTIMSNALSSSGSVLWSMPDGEQDLEAFQARILGRGLQAIWEEWAIDSAGTRTGEGQSTSLGEASSWFSPSGLPEGFHRRSLSGTSTGHNSTVSASINSNEPPFEPVHMPNVDAPPTWEPTGSLDFFLSDSSTWSFLE